MTGTVALWVALLSLGLSGLLSTLIHAMSRTTRASAEQAAMRSGKPGRAARVAAIMSDEDHHLSAMALPRAILNLTVVVSLLIWITQAREAPASEFVDRLIAVVVGGFLVWLIGVVVPLSVAEHAADRTVAMWSWLIRMLGVLMSPGRPVLGFVMEVVRRLAGAEPSTGAEALEAEIMSVVEEGEREGQIDEGARDMIEAVVEFHSTTVEQIMTPRTEMTALGYTDDLEVLKRFVREAAHSRLPVYEENLDHIIGVLYLKDLLRWMVVHAPGDGETFSLRKILRPASFVPETKTVRELLTELLANKVHIAIVADEYGGTSGLVTFEDIVEEIFGEIQDEYEPEEEGPAPVAIDAESRAAEIDARMDIDDANDELEPLAIELPSHDDYDTVGGFVVVTLGRIPEAGETFTHERVRVSVLDAEPTRVKRVRVERVDPQRAEETPLSEQAVK
ncbi:MAG: HlyC/CorC family transporter [Leptolyngbya sp. PLA3]|nr:MAG: HlyC/CorC family transporter [Cyanobacteria bacterium CYA]MCE7968728.1 HlyC/CorC family transporter [Leptolyngbya sp. PL-A3]